MTPAPNDALMWWRRWIERVDIALLALTLFLATLGDGLLAPTVAGVLNSALVVSPAAAGYAYARHTFTAPSERPSSLLAQALAALIFATTGYALCFLGRTLTLFNPGWHTGKFEMNWQTGVEGLLYMYAAVFLIVGALATWAVISRALQRMDAPYVGVVRDE